MFRSLLIIALISFFTALAAVPEFVPSTIIAENLTSTNCQNYPDADTGLGVLHSQMHNGEFISARYYTASGALSNQDAEDRAIYYNQSIFPTVLFNGVEHVIGTGQTIADGSDYLNVVNSLRFRPSPIKLSINSFNSSTGSVSAKVTIIEPGYLIYANSLRFILLENEVTPSASHVVRAVLSQIITMTGTGAQQDYTATFTISPEYVQANLWVAVIVQNTNKAIIQATSSLSQPQVQIRAAMPFSSTLVDTMNTAFISQPIWFFNNGAQTDYTIRLLKDDGPDDWYLNYCDEDGLCYSGSTPTPFTLAADAYKGFHLNLWIGSSGFSHFHFVVEAPNMQPYIIPFTLQTIDTANEDNTLPVPSVKLQQNFPNPFSQNTSFRIFAKQASAPVKLEIFNSKGERIRTLQTDRLSTGLNHINWNGTAENGKPLPTGIYYYRLKDLAPVVTQKLLIINK